MKQFEYQILNSNERVELTNVAQLKTLLFTMGNDGWELISINNGSYLFKREKDNSKEREDRIIEAIDKVAKLLKPETKESPKKKKGLLGN